MTISSKNQPKSLKRATLSSKFRRETSQNLQVNRLEIDDNGRGYNQLVELENDDSI